MNKEQQVGSKDISSAMIVIATPFVVVFGAAILQSLKLIAGVSL